MILSTIKECIKHGDEGLYHQYFDKGLNTVKPYTFSVYLPNPTLSEKKDCFFLSENRMDVVFSTCDPIDIAMLHNGHLKMKQSKESLYYKNDLKLEIETLQVVNEPIFRIESGSMTVKTLSPFVIRDHRPEPADPENQLEYICWSDCQKKNQSLSYFNEKLNMCMKPVFQNYLGQAADIEVSMPFRISKQIIHTSDEVGKRGFVFANQGTFTLKGKSEVLALVYKAGLGSRRSYGFGCLELVK